MKINSSVALALAGGAFTPPGPNNKPVKEVYRWQSYLKLLDYPAVSGFLLPKIYYERDKIIQREGCFCR
jgi:hypothetical protein